MCFSASASFTASALLGFLGFYAAYRPPKKMRLLSYIPFIFSLQQFSEGLVWLSAQGTVSAALGHYAHYFFLFVALIFWPIYIPVAIWYTEKDLYRKKIIRWCILGGCFVSGWFIYNLFVHGSTFYTKYHHISYVIDQSIAVSHIFGVLYALATILPCFISSLVGMPIIGIGFAISYIITYLSYYCCFLSVWCFLAAVLSVCLIATIRWNRL